MAGDIQIQSSGKADQRLKNRHKRVDEQLSKQKEEIKADNTPTYFNATSAHHLYNKQAKEMVQAEEMAQAKKTKLERRAQWWQGVRDSLKEQGQEFLNYWTYDPDAEQKEEEKSSTNTGDSSTNTTTGNLNGNRFGLNVPSRFEMATPKDQREAYSELGLFPSGGVTTSNGATTSGGATSHQQAAQEAMRKNAKSYADYAKRVAGGASAYGELLREAIQQKNNIAFRKERSARAQAIANALGTLVNTITAGAIAKKNGTIPIIAGHDATADTNLRKSIEDRYAMENESENLLMQLVNSRIAHEKELAKAQLDADLKTNELGYKAASEDLKAAAKKEEAQATREWRTQMAKDNADLKREFAKAKSTRVYINNSGGKVDSNEVTTFAYNVTKGHKVPNIIDAAGQKVQLGYKDYEIKKEDNSAFSTIYKALKSGGLDDDKINEASEILNSWWGDNRDAIVSNPKAWATKLKNEVNKK